LEKTILEIYREHNIIPSIEEFISKKYLIEDKIGVFRDFLGLTFKNVFEYYVNSKQYVKDYYHIQNREGEKFAILFNYISKIFIQYYTKSKGNRPKKEKIQSVNLNSDDSIEIEDNLKLPLDAEFENNKIGSNINIFQNNKNSILQEELNLDMDDKGMINSIELCKNVSTQNLETENLKKKKKEVRCVPQQIKRKPVFKRIKVKRVCLKKKIVKICDNSPPIFEIKKSSKRDKNRKGEKNKMSKGKSITK
jgi:hypothetical protein